MARLRLGIDIGSISINTVLMDASGRLLEEHYTYCHGRPYRELLLLLEGLLQRHGGEELASPVFTGSGGERAAALLGGRFVNEIVAQSAAVEALHPASRSIIEMGGEDSKLIILGGGVARLRDFAMNSMCAAGTGSFLDQQARRMGVSIVDEFGQLALQSRVPPRIAGRCSVFAKSDMIHLQQIATPVHDIAAGLCFAVARNFTSNLARGRKIEAPVVFQGGVAANAGMVRAFREVLGLTDGALIVPEYHASMGAIGALLRLPDEGTLTDLGALRRHLDAPVDREALQGLGRAAERPRSPVHRPRPDDGVVEVALGVDVGSLSTNLVLLDGEDRVVARRYLPTASRPLEAIQRGLSELFDEVGDRVRVIAAGTTGSGRYLTGDFIGADLIQNEITAQATAAIAIDPRVDTIFEIGGQDSKFIRIENGIVVDFEMNKVCAAGTGSFLEEQAEKLELSIVDEFADRALSAAAPVRLGDRCTVFMESDLNAQQQRGAQVDDLIAGLAYSIVYNYLRKVVGPKPVGEHIFFQGGVANNEAVVSAFRQVTGKEITVPPHFDVTGAIGAAMLARDRLQGASVDGERAATRFKGFGVRSAPFTLTQLTCRHCENRCQIRRVSIGGERRRLFYGGRCERWESAERRSPHPDTPNLFLEREELLLGDYSPERGSGRATIGLPRALMGFYGNFPFWRGFFEELGFRVVLSRPTDQALVTRSLGMLAGETCFPVSVVYGHVMELLDRGVDHVFLPFVVNARADEGNPTVNYNCPWVQTHPFMIKSALRARGDDHLVERLLTPALHFRYFEHVLQADLIEFARGAFGLDARSVRRALNCADEAQRRFEERLEERGREVLEALPEDLVPLVIIGRPYNTGDAALNLSLAEKLIRLGAFPLPMDYLPLSTERIFPDYYMMCWPNGQRILAAARIIARDSRLGAVHLSNFRCGPDSFLAHYLREELAGKPSLTLEVDEHSADAGMLTRCEAFLDSLAAQRSRRVPAQSSEPERATSRDHHFRMPDRGGRSRVLYFPYMADGGYALAAASRSCGVDAWVLPMQDERDIELGRRYTSSKECFPMICTLGSFLKKIQEPGFVPEQSAFFMPDHAGPCRFGQYNKLQRIVFDRLGYPEVEIVAPTNENAYAGLSGGHGNRFRLAALRGLFAVDLLRKLLQESRPYEAVPGSALRLYRAGLERVVSSTEGGAKDIRRVLAGIAEEFRGMRRSEGPRRPIVAIVGEIFMRDNPFCSGFLVDRLERLGVETLMTPFTEWMTYSTLRYARDSRWKRDLGGSLRAGLQGLFTGAIVARLQSAVDQALDPRLHTGVGEMLERCAPYIHRDYDGDPPIALGAAAILADAGISGVANILPFTCLPGTVVGALSESFRRDHAGLPWVNIDFDGQEDTGLETRLQAFVHQVADYHHSRAALAQSRSFR